MEPSDYPPLYVTADRASLWGQRWHRRIISANLVLIIAGAGFTFVADGVGGTLRIVAAAIAAVFLIAGMLPRKLHSRVRDDKHWFEGRAIAETVKSLTWRYMMRVPPFADDAGADATLVSLLNEVKDDVTGVESIRNAEIDERQITTRMREIRSLDLVDRRNIYEQERLANQIGWYRQRAEFNRSRADRWSRVNIIFELAAVAAAICVIFSPNPWLNATWATSTAHPQLRAGRERARAHPDTCSRRRHRGRAGERGQLRRRGHFPRAHPLDR
jgi:hypothetical protein